VKQLIRISLFLLTLAVLMSACGKVTTGIQGKVVLANCTGSQIATDCTAQSTYSASLILYNENLVKLKTYRTKGDGTFLIGLKPGTYYVHPEPEAQGQFPMAADFKVVVTEGKLTDLTIYYDTGERPLSTPAP
jgi:hypothetical protein